MELKTLCSCVFPLPPPTSIVLPQAKYQSAWPRLHNRVERHLPNAIWETTWVGVHYPCNTSSTRLLQRHHTLVCQLICSVLLFAGKTDCCCFHCFSDKTGTKVKCCWCCGFTCGKPGQDETFVKYAASSFKHGKQVSAKIALLPLTPGLCAGILKGDQLLCRQTRLVITCITTNQWCNNQWCKRSSETTAVVCPTVVWQCCCCKLRAGLYIYVYMQLESILLPNTMGVRL